MPFVPRSVLDTQWCLSRLALVAFQNRSSRPWGTLRHAMALYNSGCYPFSPNCLDALLPWKICFGFVEHTTSTPQAEPF